MRRNAIKISPGTVKYYFCFEFVNEFLFTEKAISNNGGSVLSNQTSPSQF